MEAAYKTDDDAKAEAVDKEYAEQYEDLRVKKEEINEAQSKTNELLKKATEELEHQKRLKEAGSQLNYEVEKYDFASDISDRKELNELLRETSERIGLIENAAARVASKIGEEKSEILATNKEYRKLKHTLDTLNDIKGEIDGNKMFSGVGKGLESAVSKFKKKLKGLFDKIPGLNKFKGSLKGLFDKIPGADKFSGNMKEAFNKGEKPTKSFGKSVKKNISGALKGVKKVASGVFGSIGKLAGKVGDKMKSAFSSGAKSALKLGGSIFAAKGAYSLLKNVVSNYLNENEALQNQISGLTSAFGELLGPAINFVVSALSKAISYVSAFTNALFGVNLVAKANKKSLKAQSAAAEELKRSTAGFDEITTLGNNSSSGSSSSSSSSSSAGFSEIKMPDWGQKIVDSFESGDWAGAATLLTDKLSSLVKGVDWTGIGAKIGNYLNSALTFLATAILNFDWFSLGSSLATGLNNILYNVDWGNLGVVLGAKIIILLKTIAGFFSTFDWQALGKALADSFMGLWNAIDWAESGKMLSDGISGLLGTIATFLEEMDWQQIGNDIATFIRSIDFGAICSSLFEGIGAALAGIAALIWGLLEDAWNDVIDWWRENAYEDGEFTMEGLLDGIGEKLKDIRNWIHEHIFQPFITGFKKAFGIASPSKEMREQGGFIMEGLFNGITEKIEKIKSAAKDIKEAILGVFNNFGTKLKEKFSEAWKKVKDVFSEKGKIFDGIKEGISETFKNIVNRLIDGINKIVSTPFNAINKMLNRIRDIKVLGAQPFVNLWDYNPLAVPQIPQLKLAKGGIVNNPGRGVVTAITGEDGREAVLPLDKNTGWIDELAEKLAGLLGAGGQIVIPIYLDGKVIAKYIVDLKEKRAFMSNGRITV